MDILAALVTLFVIIFFVLILPCVIGLWGIFKKAGEDGWKSLIPVYNLLVLLKIVGKPWWWIFLVTINYIFMLAWSVVDGNFYSSEYQVLNFICSATCLTFLIWTFNMLSKSFGKDEGYTVGFVFIPFIMLPILGYNKSRYLGPYGDSARFAEYQSNRGEGFDFEQDKLA